MEHMYMLLWGFAGLCLLLFYLRHKQRIRALLLGGSTGLASLLLLHLFGGAVGVSPSLCTTNLLIAGALGVPGTALIVLAEKLL